MVALVIVTGTFESRTVLWDVFAQKLRELNAPALTDASSLHWSPSGVVAWADFQSGVRAWNDRSGEPVDLARDLNSATALALHSAGQRLAVSDSASIHILDLQRRRSLSSLELPPTTRTGVAFSPDGSRLALASSDGLAIFDGTSADDGVLRFWKASDGRVLASLYTLASSRDWLLVAPDGRVDGSERALAGLVAWRAGDRVSFNKSLTDRRRVRRLWRSLSQ
jgi:WD40 repeat protein